MKFSIRQILASTAGAVCAAVIASVFGVKGTIVGVAIGSAAATMATAFIAQSIDRGHQVVKQVAVRAPESSTLLRRLGGTGTSGPASSSVDADASSAPTEVVGQSGPKGAAAPETIEMATDTPATQTRAGDDVVDDTTDGREQHAARLFVARHRRNRGHRVRPGAAARHGDRADFGQAPVDDLRRRGHRHLAGECRQPVAGAAHHHTDLDHLDHWRVDLHHDDDRRNDHDEHHGAEGKREHDDVYDRVVVDDDHGSRPERVEHDHVGPMRAGAVATSP